MLSFDRYLTISVHESTQQDRRAGKKSKGKRSREEEIAYGKESAFNFTHKTSGMVFEPGIHGPAQARDRRPEFTKEDWKKLHRKVYWYIRDNDIKAGTFLFYNEEKQQGYVAAVRAKGKEVRIITVLPKGKYNPSLGGSNTDLALVEEIQLALDEAGVFYESLDSIELIYI